MSCKRKKGVPFGPESNVSFHRFPSEEELFVKWLRAIGVQNTSVVRWQNNMYLCSDHFEKEDFLKDQENTSSELPNIRKLKSTAIPHLYVTPSPSKELSSAETGTEKDDTNDPQEIPNSFITVPQAAVKQDQKVETGTLKNKGTKKFEQGTTFAVKQLKKQQYPGYVGKVNTPRYMGDVSLSDMENPRKAKVCLYVAKSLLLKQTNSIKQLKNENRVLCKKLESLRKIARIAKKIPVKPNNTNETITLLVNME